MYQHFTTNPKTVTVFYIDKEKNETIHQHINQIYHDDAVWYLLSADYVSIHLQFYEVLRIEYQEETIERAGIPKGWEE